MIDTQTAINDSSTSLQMYSFDNKQIIDRFHDQMVDYLKNDNNASCGFFKDTLATTPDFKRLDIGDWGASNICLKPASVIKQGDRSVSEFATYILELYTKYLHREQTRLSKMNFKQIYSITGDYDGKDTMFSATAYADWIINNLDKLHGSCCANISYLDESNVSNYFLKRLILKLPKCDNIDSVSISDIIDRLLWIYHDTPIPVELSILSKQMKSFTENSTILHQKFTNLDEMNYSILFRLFHLARETMVELPLVAIFEVYTGIDTDKNINADNVQFYVTNKDELIKFINQFINEVDRDSWHFTAEILAKVIKHKIIFYFKDYQNDINNQIKAIHKHFWHIQKLEELTDVLSLLLENAIYDDHNFVN